MNNREIRSKKEQNGNILINTLLPLAKYGAPPFDKRLSSLLFDSHADIAKKAYFSVCGWDPRRDESLLLEQLLKEEGLDTKLDVYPGLPHGFWTTCPDLPESKRWLEKLLQGLSWIFDEEP